MIVFPYRYCGSPLSGRVDLEGRCECGWKGFEMVSGWRIRATTLRDQISNDTLRNIKLNVVHRVAKPATIEGLLAWLRQ